MRQSADRLNVRTSLLRIRSMHEDRGAGPRAPRGTATGAFDKLEETIMRVSRNIAVSAGFIVACAGALICSPADAAPLGAAQGVRAAAESVSPVENAACWRFGWHGW